MMTDPGFEHTINNYPDQARRRLEELRTLVLEAAEETGDTSNLHETLKWGEPSFVTRHGSTLRMDWKEKTPDQFAMYFKCTSKLVTTFRLIYPDVFQFEGNRAIVFQMNDPIPKKELKECIKATLTYHKVKQLPNLGIPLD